VLKDGEYPAKHCVRVMHFLPDFMYCGGNMNCTGELDLSFPVLDIDYFESFLKSERIEHTARLFAASENMLA
jgi:hypothetical protein